MPAVDCDTARLHDAAGGDDSAADTACRVQRYAGSPAGRADPELATEPAVAVGDPSSIDAASTAPAKEAHLVPQPPPATIDPSTAANGHYKIGAADGVPSAIILAAQQLVESNPDQFTWLTPGTETPDILLTINEGEPIATWVYTVAVPFATVTDATTYEAIASGWQSGQSELGTLLLAGKSTPALQNILGALSPAPTAGSDLIGELWAGRPELDDRAL